MLIVAVVRSSSDDSVIRYILPVLRMTSCFHIMGPVEQNQRRHYVLSSLPGDGTESEVCCLLLLCWYWCRRGRIKDATPVLSTVLSLWTKKLRMRHCLRLRLLLCSLQCFGTNGCMTGRHPAWKNRGSSSNNLQKFSSNTGGEKDLSGTGRPRFTCKNRH